MAPSPKKMLSDLDRALTDLSTAQAVQRIILQCFLLNFARVVENPDAFVDSIKHQVLASLENEPADKNHLLEEERLKQVLLFQAEHFFQELEAAGKESWKDKTMF
jgi:hypothetical protein